MNSYMNPYIGIYTHNSHWTHQTLFVLRHFLFDKIPVVIFLPEGFHKKKQRKMIYT